MTPLVKLTVIFEIEKVISLAKNHLLFLYLLYILRKNSHISCPLAPINFLKKIQLSDSDGVEKSCKTKLWLVTKCYVSVLFYCIIRQCEINCFVRSEFACVSNLLYHKKAYFISFCLCIKGPIFFGIQLGHSM